MLIEERVPSEIGVLPPRGCMAQCPNRRFTVIQRPARAPFFVHYAHHDFNGNVVLDQTHCAAFESALIFYIRARRRVLILTLSFSCHYKLTGPVLILSVSKIAKTIGQVLAYWPIVQNILKNLRNL